MSAETRDDLLASIEEEAGRLNRFVTNLFEITRIESGMLRAKCVPTDLGVTIKAAVGRAMRLHPRLNVDISVAEPTPHAEADPALLEQVLFNLLDNAAKYAADAPVSIFARREDNAVRITVTDQGKGIPEQDLDRIFEKFYRRGKSDGRPAGTGLGLAIARGLILAMGGTIRAESPAMRRRGTRFIVRLPQLEGRP